MSTAIITPSESFNKLVERVENMKQGPLKKEDVQCYAKEHLGFDRLGAVEQLMGMKLKNPKLVKFVLQMLPLIHLLFMNAVIGKQTVKKYVAPVEDKNFLIIISRGNYVDKTVKYPADGVSLFSIALQLELILYNVKGMQDIKKSLEKDMAKISGEDVFEIGLLKFLARQFQTFRIVGEQLNERVVTIDVSDQLHWMVMVKLLDTKNCEYLDTILKSPFLDFIQEEKEEEEKKEDI